MIASIVPETPEWLLGRADATCAPCCCWDWKRYSWANLPDAGNRV